MKNFADRLISAIEKKGNPCMVGLDPRIEQIPDFLPSSDIEQTITNFNTLIIDTIKDIIPVVKPQIAFYEQYGIAGMKAFANTIKIAKDAGLIVVADVKRNDISSTAEAYANAFLKEGSEFEVDCITVSPFLGRDSLIPFVESCKKHGKGLFILVKTSNPGSGDFQDVILKDTNEPMYVTLAKMVDDLGKDVIGGKGYSSIGAVVGATFPEQAEVLRKLMPKSIFLVPGYGSQGGTGEDTILCFNADKFGAVINASRSITFAHKDKSISREDFTTLIRTNTESMIADVTSALKI